MDGIAISVQVLAEFYRNAVNPKNGKSLSKSDARDLVAAWKRHKVINNSVEVLNAALDIAAQTNFQIFDCLIIAAAKVAGCSLLLSEDMHDGQTVGGVRIENPFRAS